MFGISDDDATAAVEWNGLIGEKVFDGASDWRFAADDSATRFLDTRFFPTQWIGPQNTKGASPGAAPLVPFRFFCLYI